LSWGLGKGREGKKKEGVEGKLRGRKGRGGKQREGS